MSVLDMLGERSSAITSGAVSVTKGEGAGRHAGPAAAIVISIAAPISRSGALSRRRAVAPDGQGGEQVRCDVRRPGAASARPLAAKEQPEPGERRQRQQHRAGAGR